MLAATVRRARFPLLPLPTVDDIRTVRADWEPRLNAAIAAGEGGAARIAYWHVGWARNVERMLTAGTAPTFREGPIHAIRIGDGVIVSGPGEVFTEIGLAVKERSPVARYTRASRTVSSPTSRVRRLRSRLQPPRARQPGPRLAGVRAHPR